MGRGLGRSNRAVPVQLVVTAGRALRTPLHRPTEPGSELLPGGPSAGDQAESAGLGLGAWEASRAPGACFWGQLEG